MSECLHNDVINVRVDLWYLHSLKKGVFMESLWFCWIIKVSLLLEKVLLGILFDRTSFPRDI